MEKGHTRKRVIGYLRVSTETQDLGPQAQEAALREWCQKNDADLVGLFSDIGVSGAAPLEKREGLMAAMNALKAEKATVLLISKRDRLARDTVIAALTERLVSKAGAEIVSADGAANGTTIEAQLMRNVVASFAQYERQVISLRTRLALGVKKKRGERVGNIRFGAKLAADGINLEENLEELALLDDMVEMKKAGHTFQTVTNELNRRGVPARGKKWHYSSVRKILTRELERRNAEAATDVDAA
jgi:site-specific DNA recombinase